MKEKQQEKQKQNIGDVINELSSQPIPFELQVGDKTFNLVMQPPGVETLMEWGSIAKEDTQSLIRFFASACIKDSDGNKVWNSMEDVKVSGMAYVTVRNIIYKYALGVDLSEFAIKNLQGSPSLSPVS